jgi:polysaccharide export outer membrane protein
MKALTLPWLIAALLIASNVGAAGYTLKPGDTIEVTIGGLPDRSQRATVDIEGNVYLSSVGVVRAVNRSFEDVRSEIQTGMAQKPVRVRTQDGKGQNVVLDVQDVKVAIVEYRPVYVSGDVAKPGEQGYRPGMTVRQAVAMAGGYDVVRLKMSNPLLEAEDLKAQIVIGNQSHVAQNARIKRIKTELLGRQDLTRDQESSGDKEQQSSRIWELEDQYLHARSAEFQSERAGLQTAINNAKERVRILQEQQTKESEGVSEDEYESARLQELLKLGTVATTRVTDARRALLLSKTRLLQVTAQLGSAQRDFDDFSRELGKLQESRKVGLLHNLEEEEIALHSTATQLKAAKDKLQYIAALQSQFLQGKLGKVEITIFREEDNHVNRTQADEDTKLEPGDSLQVAIRIGSS